MIIGANYSRKVFASASKKEKMVLMEDDLKENNEKFELIDGIESLISIEEQKTVTLSFIGDTLLGSDLKYGESKSFVETFEVQNKNYGYFFENVVSILEKDDITVSNLENPLTDATKMVGKEFAFKGDPTYTNILKAASIEAVNIENNHIKDYFDVGYEDTKKYLYESGIAYFGDKINYIKEVKGVKVGFLGYQGWNFNGETTDKIELGINDLKQNGADIIVVSFHWGEEKNNYVTDIQKKLAQFSVDKGADIVVGHHAHVISGIEIYKDKPIIYGLGNFCFGGNRNPVDKDTFIYQQTFTFKDNEKTVNNVKIIPCSISSVSQINDFKPTPLYGKDSDRVLHNMLKYSDGMNSEQFIKDNFYVHKND